MPTLSDDPLTPYEAADRLHHLAGELERHGVPAEHIETLRLISQRFTRHLHGLETFYYRLDDLAKEFQC